MGGGGGSPTVIVLHIHCTHHENIVEGFCLFGINHSRKLSLLEKMFAELKLYQKMFFFKRIAYHIIIYVDSFLNKTLWWLLYNNLYTTISKTFIKYIKRERQFRCDKCNVSKGVLSTI